MPGGYGKVTAPRRWQSSPDHPTAQLAYVTQDEIDMLVDANIYGSMDGEPNRGPQGIISLQGDIGGYEPPSQPSGGNGGGNGGGGGQGPHWDPSPPVVTVPPPWVADPTPIIPVHEIIDEPVDYNLDDEKTDYLGGQLVSNMTNEEIASYSSGQTYNPNTGLIESSYHVPQHDAISESQANYEKYGDDLRNWPETAKLQAKQSGFFGMQAEGMLGGVTGLEQEINAQKKIIQQGGAGYDQALASLTTQFGNEELAKVNALGIQEYLNRKSKGNPKVIEDIISGQTKIEGLSPDFFKNFVYGGDDPDKSKQIGTAGLSFEKDPSGKYIGGDALGYDPSGVYTWGDVGELGGDPWLKEAYYGLTTGDPTQIPDWLYDKYLKEILYTGGPTFDDWWYGDKGTPWKQEWWDYPLTDETQTAKLPHWRSEALPTEMLSMGEMEPMYGPEFGEELMASSLYMPGLESTTGIPYQGKPEFGTIEMPV